MNNNFIRSSNIESIKLFKKEFCNDNQFFTGTFNNYFGLKCSKDILCVGDLILLFNKNVYLC